MGYNSMGERKPFERASSVNHSHIIKNKEVQTFLSECEIPKYTLENIKYPEGNEVNLDELEKVKNVIAIDGGYSETYIEKGFPSTSLAFFDFGVLLFQVEDLINIEKSYIINPEDLKKLKEINKIPLVIPSKNILVKNCNDFCHGVRKTIYDFFKATYSSAVENETLIDVLEWLMAEAWSEVEKPIKLEFCPYEDCTCEEIIFNAGESKKTCSKCGREVYLTDYFRFHEIINEPNGASGIFGYLTSLIEQVLMIQIIKYFYENNIQVLASTLFIKDGPLAFFGQTFRLHIPMRKLIAHLFDVNAPKDNLINIVGIEKSGPFVEHAFYIQDRLEANKYYILNDAYIRKYILPQNSKDEYGHNTYYGWKVIYKTPSSDVLVLTIPVKKYSGSPSKEDFANIDRILGVLAKMRCNMYENSLVPLALINKLVSISEYPSSNILEKYIKQNITK